MFLIRKEIFIFTAVLISLSACAEKQIEREIYLIPEAYTGSFFIVYDVSSGLKAQYEGEARVFNVPETGMIHTQFTQNYGVGEPGMIRFFYVSKEGARKEITDYYGATIKDSVENRKDKKIYVMGGGFGEFGFNQKTTEQGCKYNDQSFYIGTLADRLEGVGAFQLEDYYVKYGYPCP